jgi:hypothetical protein
MFTTEALKELEQRKRALVKQSDIRRAMLELQCARLEPYLGYIDKGVGFFRKPHPVWAFAAPFLGVWAARRLKKVADWIAPAFLSWKAIRKGMELWQNFQQSHVPGPSAEPPESMFTD